eukprot:9546102-Karenia_brevis.AAC.1
MESQQPSQHSLPQQQMEEEQQSLVKHSPTATIASGMVLQQVPSGPPQSKHAVVQKTRMWWLQPNKTSSTTFTTTLYPVSYTHLTLPTICSV